MSYKYKLLPVLKNPVKTFKGVKIRHSEHQYLRDFYDPVELAANPFAQSLKSTRNDISRCNFPIGDMIQVVVAKDAEGYWLRPVLEKPVEGQNPAKFVLNSEMYIDFHRRKRFFPLPMKYMARSAALIPKIKVIPDFQEEVERLYTNRIKELLTNMNIEKESKTSEEATGIQVNSGANTSIDWSLGQCIITTDVIAKPKFISFKANPDLAQALVQLANFKSRQ